MSSAESRVRVIVVDLRAETRSCDTRRLAEERASSSSGCDVVVIVGTDDLNSLQQQRMPSSVRVSAPLYGCKGRRFPDVRHSSDTTALAWSLATMSALQEVTAGVGEVTIEFPSQGALAYATIQERATSHNFAHVDIEIRFDGLASLDAVRCGSNVEMQSLMLMDMERMCLEQADRVLVEGPDLSASLLQLLPASRNRLRLAEAQWTWHRESCDEQPASKDIFCVATQPCALRQITRGLVGYLSRCPEDTARVLVSCPESVFGACADVLPAVFMNRFTYNVDPQLDASGMRAILCDTWTASGVAARELLASGATVMVDQSNPCYGEASEWPETMCHHDGTAAGVERALKAARETSPVFVRGTLDWPAAEGRASVSVPCPGQAAQLVSVIVPCFNMGQWLRFTLRNIARFSWSNVEVIVVDDGSTDQQTCSILQELEERDGRDIRILRLGFNQGLSAARNAGLALATGDYAMALDADDMVSSDFVALAVSALQRNPDHDFVVPRAAYFSEEGNDGDVRRLRTGPALPMVGAAFDSGIFANRFSTATSLARTAVLRRLGYDEALRSYEDWQLYRRALQSGSRFYVTNDVHFYYRQRADSMIHDPAMRARHSVLYAEMGSRPAMSGRPFKVPAAAQVVLAAPAEVEGGEGGLLLSGVNETLDEIKRLRRSRIVGIAFKLSAVIRRMRR